MGTYAVLLRGINLGPNNRLAMPALREALTGAGYRRVRTHGQSGNVVLDTRQASARLTVAIATLLAEQFELTVPVVVRTASELAQVVADNPFPHEAVSQPKALQVTFCAEKVSAQGLTALQARARPSEQVAARRREIYSWHPDGIARSKLALALTPKDAVATARNWTTVTTLLEMATTDAG